MLKAASSQGLQRSVLGLGAPDWALALLLLSDVWMEGTHFQVHQPSMGPPWSRGSRLSFPSHPLLSAWGNREFLLCPIISLCCAMPAGALGE